MEIDLDSFQKNLAEIRRLVGPKVKVMEVLKADAYGHGAIEMANVAIKNGVYSLGVANADEGVQLRISGIDAPIVILSPSPTGEIDDIIKYSLTPSVSDLAFACDLDGLAGKAGSRIPIHIEVDTGMGRGESATTKPCPSFSRSCGFPNSS